MARPVTGWTGPAVVNGVLAIVLLVWLANGTSRGARPEPKPPDDVAERVEVSEANARPDIVLPAPPRPGPPDRPGAAAPAPSASAGAPEPPMELVPLRAAEAVPDPAPPPVRAPLRPAETATPVPNPPVAENADRPASRPPEAVVKVDDRAVSAGRALLRIFEHGDGPGIEIAWPASARARARLHDVLSRCFGMRLALIDRAGALYTDDGPAGRPWPIDLDRFSGFVRRPSGGMTAAERGNARRIARRHRGLAGAEPVRLFPRSVDAALLGGLSGLIGDGYRTSRVITAAYRLRGDRIAVDGVRVDGRAVSGEIDLSRVAAPVCRRPGRA